MTEYIAIMSCYSSLRYCVRKRPKSPLTYLLMCVANPTSGGTAGLEQKRAGTTRIDAADRARIGLCVGSSVAPSVRHRYQGKGIAPFLAWRRNRGWSEDGPEPSWLDDMSPALAAELLGAYVCELRLQGKNADTAIQALRHDYEKASRSLTVFGFSSVSATRKKRPREFDRETALSRQRAARSPITGSMMSEAITRHFPPGMVISPQNRDSAAAILAGLIQFAFALRVGNVVRTVSSTSALKWAHEQARAAAQAGASVPSDLADRLLKSHCFRASDVSMAVTVGGGERWLPAHRWVSERPSVNTQAQKVVFNVLTTKTTHSGGKPVKHMATATHGGGEEHLVRMVNAWVEAAGYSGADDLFLSTVSLAPTTTLPRWHATENLVNELARSIGARTSPGQLGFSSQSFKVGAVSELSAMGDGQHAVAAFTGHKTTSALMHYNRKRMSCKVPTLMAVTDKGANYTKEDATIEWASSAVNVSPTRKTVVKGRPRKVNQLRCVPTPSGTDTAAVETQVTPNPPAATKAVGGRKRVTPVLLGTSLPTRDQTNQQPLDKDPLRAVQERFMDLGRRIKRAEQAEARQNTAFGGAMSLHEQAPASFEEDFGVNFASYLHKPQGNLHDEAEVDDDVLVSPDESEDEESVTTRSSERADPITEWTAQSSEAQPELPPEKFGKWVHTPPGRLSQGGTGGRSCHRGAPSKMWAWVSPSHQGETTHGADAPGGHL